MIGPGSSRAGAPVRSTARRAWVGISRGPIALRVAVVVAVVVAVASQVLPAGVPAGVVALGVVYGATTGLTALGLVLVYRAARIINFAQAEMGGLAVAVAVLAVTGLGLPYPVGVVVGLVAAAGTGAAVEGLVVRRFRQSSRLILTVATIGVAQVVGAGQLALPSLFGDLEPFSTFATPFDRSFSIGAILFTGDHLVALAAAAVATAALGWFLSASDIGVAIRGAADSGERAQLLGIPVARLSRTTWIVAALLSGIGSIVLTPLQGVSLGAIAGATGLLPAMTAAVIGRLTSLPATMAAAVGIGVFEQVVFWSYPRSSVVSVLELGMVLVALGIQRRSTGRTSEAAEAVVAPVRPLPDIVRSAPGLRRGVALALTASVVAALVAPSLVSDSQLAVLTGTAIFSTIAVSLVILVGWAGQISLGQFAFVGIGAGVAGGLVATAGADLFVAMAVATLIGAIAAVGVGLPALRIPGLFLAVATLAFAVPVSEYLLSERNFPRLAPAQVGRPELFGVVSLDSERAYFWFSLVVAVAVLVFAANLRRSRIGRAIIAVRDNERAAAMFALSPSRIKLLAFGLSGALAGLAGAQYVLLVRGVGFGAFNPQESLTVFTMVVVGGLGSLTGAVLGAVYLQLVAYALEGAWQLFATGAGLLVLLLVLPGGLGELVVRARDRYIAGWGARRQIDIPGFCATVEPAEDVSGGAASDHQPHPSGSVAVVDSEGAPAPLAAALVTGGDLDASYGTRRILHGLDLAIADGEIVALLGTNGAGKSTLLKVIAGLIPTGGTLSVGGRDLGGVGPEDRVAAGIVLVPGGAGVFPNLTVDENLRTAGWLLRRDPSRRAEARAGVEARFPKLVQRRSSLAGSLSGGEQQMLALAMAEMCRPRLLLIDELSLGLAPKIVAELLASVREMVATGMTVIVVEQSLNVAAALAPRALFLERGAVRFDGATADLDGRGDLARAVFLGTDETGDADADAVTGPSAHDPIGGLTARSMSVRFGGITAVDDVDLDVAPGQIVGLIGANGAGKTTLLDACSGFVPVHGGTLWINGADMGDCSPDRRAERGLGRVFQDARLFPTLTVTETIAVALDHRIDVREPVALGLRIGAARRSESWVRDRTDEIIENLSLGVYANSFIAELSTGTRRVVELACVLAQQPATLFLDEPTSGLAQRESEALAVRLLHLRAATGMAMVIVEHDMPMLRAVADGLVAMESGRVIAVGTPSEVLADPAVVHSYLGSDATAIERSGATAALS